MVRLEQGALVAGDLAAPAEAAPAVDGRVELHGGVAATAAHPLTAAVLLETPAPLRTQTAQPTIRLAERWTFLGEDESLAEALADALCRRQTFAVIAGHHLDGPVKAGPQPVADLAELGHPSPARAPGARARQAVTFAREIHVPPDRLRAEEEL